MRGAKPKYKINWKQVNELLIKEYTVPEIAQELKMPEQALYQRIEAKYKKGVSDYRKTIELPDKLFFELQEGDIERQVDRINACRRKGYYMQQYGEGKYFLKRNKL